MAQAAAGRRALTVMTASSKYLYASRDFSRSRDGTLDSCAVPVDRDGSVREVGHDEAGGEQVPETEPSTKMCRTVAGLRSRFSQHAAQANSRTMTMQRSVSPPRRRRAEAAQ